MLVRSFFFRSFHCRAVAPSFDATTVQKFHTFRRKFRRPPLHFALGPSFLFPSFFVVRESYRRWNARVKRPVNNLSKIARIVTRFTDREARLPAPRRFVGLRLAFRARLCFLLDRRGGHRHWRERPNRRRG